jgi:hypothetical protein
MPEIEKVCSDENFGEGRGKLRSGWGKIKLRVIGRFWRGESGGGSCKVRKKVRGFS